ncbi:recombinase family protein [Hansschlegelia beijingensis]|uniref:recombinase family protein n=1 Tax=Hansschlegelia beijingensis TaxID=1133344 RepID=UPI001607884B|nr:recombinase family protein [Hansschlegelia beijingensis]
MRAAIYARFSTDLQSDRSVEDQIALCADYARRRGYQVVETFHDRARSGASLFGRDGLARMVERAKAGAFDIVVAEAADRISRDMADLAGLHKQFAFVGIEIDCVNGGRLDTLQIGVHGLVGQMQREEGARKVRRGMTGVVRDGRHPGGRAYGYRPVLGKPGELEIVPAEADVIRRIFTQYAARVSPRSIAAALNAEGLPAPRGPLWNASTINGSGPRGHGILRNPIYAGRIVWNRVRMVKNPANGRRVSRPNGAEEYHWADAPHLRIVDQDLFDAVQARKSAIGGSKGRRVPRSPRILSGLLKCGCCGGGMSIVGSDRSGPRIMCSNRRESSSCANGSRYYVERIESLVVDALRFQLADPTLIDEFVGAYCADRRSREAEARRSLGATERLLTKAKAKIARIGDLLVDGVLDKADAAQRLAALRAERDRLEAEVATVKSEAERPDLRSQAIDRFGENLEALSKTLMQGDPVAPLSATFRELVAGVIVKPRAAREEYAVEIEGKLSGLLGTDVSALELVAEEGLEPPTRGL